MARTKPPFDPLAVATAPRSPASPAKEAPVPPDVEAALQWIPRHCKVCGEPTKNKTGLCLPHQRQILSLKEERTLVQNTIAANGHRYAELHKVGAEIAALKGDTRPAEWGMLHGRVIAPLKTQDGNGSRVVVNIGMVLPGCGQALPPVTVQALPGSSPDEPIDVEPLE
jgi:hypothetical protein